MRRRGGESGSPQSRCPVIAEAVILVPDASRFGVSERALWHLHRLHSPLRRRRQKELSVPDLTEFDLGSDLVLLDVSKKPDIARRRGSRRFTSSRHGSADSLLKLNDEPVADQLLAVAAGSELWYVHAKYRVVFALTLSASMLAQNNWALPIDLLADTLLSCISGLLRPMAVDASSSSSSAQAPSQELYISVVAYAAQLDEVWSLLQGFQVNVGSAASGSAMQELSSTLRRAILAAESKLSSRLAQQHAAAAHTTAGANYSSTSSSSSSVTHLEGAVQAVAFALKFLPFDAAPLAVVLTDGVGERPPSTAYDSLMMQLCRHDIPVHCVQVGTGWTGEGDAVAAAASGALALPRHSFGFVPDIDGLAHMALVTGGAHFDLATLRHALSTPASQQQQQQQQQQQYYYQRSGAQSTAQCQRVLAPTLFQRLLLFRPSPLNTASGAGPGSGARRNDSIISALGSMPYLGSMTQLSGMSSSSSSSTGNMALAAAAAGRTAAAATRLSIAAAGSSSRLNSAFLGSGSAVATTAGATSAAGVGEVMLQPEQVQRYTLARVGLERVLEMRCSEGFSAVEVHFREAAAARSLPYNASSQALSSQAGGSSSGSSSSQSMWQIGTAARPVSSPVVPRSSSSSSSTSGTWIRFTLMWQLGVRLDYVLDFLPSTEAGAAHSDIGSATVQLELTASAAFVQQFKQLQQQQGSSAGSSSDAPLHSGSSTAAALKQFMKVLVEVDKMLFQICNIAPTLTAVSSPSASAATAGAVELEQRLEIDEAATSKYLWLGSLSTMDWHRWFNVEYCEVIFRGSLAVQEPDSTSSSAAVRAAPGTESSFDDSAAQSQQQQQHRAASAASDRAKSKDQLLAAACRQWCTRALGLRGLYLRIVPQDATTAGTEPPRSAVSSSSKQLQHRSPGFALLKVLWEAPNLAVVHLGCFGVSAANRLRLLSELSSAIWDAGGHVAARRKSAIGLPLSQLGLAGAADSEQSAALRGARQQQQQQRSLLPQAGTLHKINAGTSGLETAIAFQLVRGGTSSSDSSSSAATPHARAVAASLQQQQQQQHARSRFRNMSFGKYAAPYLRRRSWLWRFGGSTTSSSSSSSSSAAAATAAVVRALAQARQLDGFVDVELTDTDALLIKGVTVVHSPEKPSLAAQRMLLQYRAYAAGPGAVAVELLMEPQYGFVKVQEESGPDGESHHRWVNDRELFQLLWRYLHASDLCVLSAFNSFAAIEAMCESAGSAGAAAAAAVSSSNTAVGGSVSSSFSARTVPAVHSSDDLSALQAEPSSDEAVALTVDVPLSLLHLLVHGQAW
jgi:hypothetical protein